MFFMSRVASHAGGPLVNVLKLLRAEYFIDCPFHLKAFVHPQGGTCDPPNTSPNTVSNDHA